MKTVEFESVDGPDYSKSRQSVYGLVLVAPCLLGVLAIFFDEWAAAFGISAVFSVLHGLNVANRSQYFIKRFSLKNEQVTIDFMEKGIAKAITGHASEFSAKKKAVLFQRTTEPYLAIYHNKKLLTKQFQVASWQENSFDAIVSALGGKVTHGMTLEI